MNTIFGNKKRIFINLKIGCDCNCTYCYLPQLERRIIHAEQLNSNEAYNIIRHMKQLKIGKNGTILSFGCYSECWSEDLKCDTLELISKLSTIENPIQISTKQQISSKSLLSLNNICQYSGHITINISMPTISRSKELEPGAASITDRLKMLDILTELDKIRFAMYIRPVLDGITIIDKDQYCQLMDAYNLPCIIGGRYQYTRKHEGCLTDVGEGYLLEKEPDDLLYLTEYLSSHGKVYNHSTDLIYDTLF